MDMKKFLKNILLWNRRSDFEIILQGCSFGDPFQKLFAKFWSAQKHGSDEWGLLALYRDMKKFLKNLILRNRWSDFEIVSQECSFGDPFQNLFAKCDPSVNMALVNGGFLHYRDMKKFLKNLLLWNCWSDFEIISQECSLGDPFQKLLQNFYLSIIWLWWMGAFCTIQTWRNSCLYSAKKSCSQKPLVRFWNNFTGIGFWH